MTEDCRVMITAVPLTKYPRGKRNQPSSLGYQTPVMFTSESTASGQHLPYVAAVVQNTLMVRSGGNRIELHNDIHLV